MVLVFLTQKIISARQDQYKSLFTLKMTFIPVLSLAEFNAFQKEKTCFTLLVRKRFPPPSFAGGGVNFLRLNFSELLFLAVATKKFTDFFFSTQLACTSKFLSVRARQPFKKKLLSKNLPPANLGGVEPFPHEKGKGDLNLLFSTHPGDFKYPRKTSYCIFYNFCFEQSQVWVFKSRSQQYQTICKKSSHFSKGCSDGNFDKK